MNKNDVKEKMMMQMIVHEIDLIRKSRMKNSCGFFDFYIP